MQARCSLNKDKLEVRINYYAAGFIDGAASAIERRATASQYMRTYTHAVTSIAYSVNKFHVRQTAIAFFSALLKDFASKVRHPLIAHDAYHFLIRKIWKNGVRHVKERNEEFLLFDARRPREQSCNFVFRYLTAPPPIASFLFNIPRLNY